MSVLLDAVYACSLLVLFPWLLYKSATTGKYRRGLWQKLTGKTSFVRTSPRRVAWFHAVSVGEVHLLRPVLSLFRQQHPDWDCVLSTTTDTGFDEARKKYPDLPVFFWPLDFSWAVGRALRRVRPDLVVLAECELWPNFLLAAKRFGVPVAVVNARMSPRSFRRYQGLGGWLRWMFRAVDRWGVQTPEYAANLVALGVPVERLVVTNSVKYDGCTTDRANPRTQTLRSLFRIGPEDLVWIAGSTQAPEEQVALDVYRRAKTAHPHLRLIIVPRQKERFDEVAGLLRQSGVPFVRRSEVAETAAPVILVDTIGELSALWGLADVAFVGGSLDGKRGGQNMIEPAAYGAAVVFGPHVWNFRDTVDRLLGVEGAVQVRDAAELETVVLRLLSHPSERDRLGTAARDLVLRQQGATARTVALLEELTRGAYAKAG